MCFLVLSYIESARSIDMPTTKVLLSTSFLFKTAVYWWPRNVKLVFATLKTQFINQFINHRRFLAILCLVCLERNVQAKQCALLWTFISKEKFKSDGYSYTHWWIDPSNLFSKTSSWVVLFQVLLDVNCCALIYLFWTYIIRIFETDARLGLVWTLLIRWWKWSSGILKFTNYVNDYSSSLLFRFRQQSDAVQSLHLLGNKYRY